MDKNRARTQAQECIQRAFIRQLHEKPLNEIKVAVLCREAAVNRSTFYSYYTDVFDLYQQMLNGIYAALLKNTLVGLSDIGFGNNRKTEDLIRQALADTKASGDLCAVLLQQGDAAFEQKILDHLLAELESRYLRFGGHDKQRFHAFCVMMLGGILALWRQWVLGGFAVPEDEIAAAMERFIGTNAALVWLTAPTDHRETPLR